MDIKGWKKTDASTADLNESTRYGTRPDNKHFKGLQGAVVPWKETSLTTIQSPNLKWEYKVLKDSLSKVLLPLEYRINDSKVGINSKDKEQAAVLGRSGCFVETGLKLVSEVQNHWGEWDQVGSLVDSILLTLTAHMRYVQEEYSSLQVGGQYGNQTKQVFRSLQRNMSNLNSEGIENLKTAVSITQPSQGAPTNSGNSNSFGNNQRGFRGFRARGQFRGGFRSRGYTPRGIPTSRDYSQQSDKQE